MRFEDTIQVKVITTDYDEDNDPIEIESWEPLGKCTIFPNEKAVQIKGNDTEPRVYSYQIVMRKPKNKIPIEGEWVHICKKDGTVDTDAVVLGFVTLGGRFLKLWV